MWQRRRFSPPLIQWLLVSQWKNETSVTLTQRSNIDKCDKSWILIYKIYIIVYNRVQNKYVTDQHDVSKY